MAEKEISSGGVVVRRTDLGLRVLLIKDSYGHWTWPKGNIEKGETPQEAAIREIGEETALKNVRLIDRIAEMQYFYKRNKKLIFKKVHIYLFEAEGDGQIAALKSEIEDARWFSSGQALETIEYKGAKAVLKKALDRFTKACQRTV